MGERQIVFVIDLSSNMMYVRYIQEREMFESGPREGRGAFEVCTPFSTSCYSFGGYSILLFYVVV